MFDGFNALSDEEYFIQRYKYYSTHQDAADMTFEEHLEDLDLLIRKLERGHNEVEETGEGTSNHPIYLAGRLPPRLPSSTVTK